MKSWAYWSSRFNDILSALSDNINANRFVTEEEKAYAMLHCDTICSIACHYYAKYNKWPLLTAESYCVIYDRINQATNLIMKLYISQGSKSSNAIVRPPNLKTTSEGDVIIWFLVDWWYETAPEELKKFRLDAVGRMLDGNAFSIVLGLSGYYGEDIYEGSEQLGLEFIQQEGIREIVEQLRARLTDNREP